MAGDLVLIVGRRPQFFAKGTFPECCLDVLMTWQLASSRTSDPREGKVEAVMSYMTQSWKSHTVTVAISHWLHIGQS